MEFLDLFRINLRHAKSTQIVEPNFFIIFCRLRSIFNLRKKAKKKKVSRNSKTKI